MEALHSYIIHINAEGKILNLNQKMLSLFRKKKLIEADFFDLCQSEQIQPLFTKEDLAQDLITSGYQTTTVLKEKNRNVAISWEVDVLVDLKQKKTYLCMGQVLAQQAINNQLKNIIENILETFPGYIYLKDKNFTYLYCNTNFSKASGFNSVSEIIGKTDFDLYWRDTEARMFRKGDEEALKGKVKINFEEPQLQSGDKKATVLASKVPLYDKNKNIIGILGSYVDITERKKMEVDLAYAKKVAEAASLAKSDFIANMSHDIRTPLTGILGLSQMILDATVDDDVKQKIQILVNSANEVLNLLNSILEVAELDAGKSEAETISFNLKDLVQRTINLFKPSMKVKKIKFEFELAPSTALHLSGKANYLERILVNLIGNAVKFTERGKIIVEVQSIPIYDDKIELNISITDTGIGIPDDKLDVIFEHFTRLTPSYQNQYQGSGLGLYAVKNYLRKLNGEIHVASKENIGSTFTITVPFLIDQAHHNSHIKPKKYQDIENFNHAKVLLIEDNHLAAIMAENILKKIVGSIEIAKSGKQALQKLQNQKYELIFMDIGLPDYSGFQLCEEILKLPFGRNIPIIALTGHMSHLHKNSALAFGMQALITKPLSYEKAIEVLTLIKKNSLMQNKKKYLIPNQITDIILDPHQTGALLGNNQALADEMIKTFAAELSMHLEIIQQLHEDRNWEKLYNLIHKLHGGLCYIEAPRLKSISAQLQDALHSENHLLIQEFITTLEDESQKFVRFVKDYYRNDSIQ